MMKMVITKSELISNVEEIIKHYNDGLTTTEETENKIMYEAIKEYERLEINQKADV